MAITREIRDIFADARQLERSALERFEAGGIRDAAEKAWCATKRVTDALIMARTGDEPGTTARTSDELDALARRDHAVRSMKPHYYQSIYRLHGQCFCNDRCNSEEIPTLINATREYIAAAERLADQSPNPD